MTTRALLTEREREVLAGRAGTDAYRATVRTRVRNRLRKLKRDAEVLEANEPELYDSVREATQVG